MVSRCRALLLLVLVAGLLLFGVPSLAMHGPGGRAKRVLRGSLDSRTAVRFAVSKALRDLPAPAPPPPGPADDSDLVIKPIEPVRVGTPGPARLAADAAVQAPSATIALMPSPSLTFEGLSNADNKAAFGHRVIPPDTNGDVGPAHYVQMINLTFRVFNKGGVPLTPVRTLGALFAPLGSPCGGVNDGDGVTLYDPLADRWLLSQLCLQTTPNRHELIAVSQTSDPTGAYFLYDFTMPNDKFNDYPKLGVWPDAYYMTDNEFDAFGQEFVGTGVFAFDRSKMLAGDPSASFLYFDLSILDPTIGGMLPSDLDGLNPPPAGTPAYFAYFTADEFGDPKDGLRVFEFHADFAHPGESTFRERPESPITVAAFNPVNPSGRQDIVQPPAPDGVQEGLDSLADRLMHRLAYRNFGDHESLVVDHTVNVSGGTTAATYHAGVRYYELRRPIPDGPFTVAEQATFAPDRDSRWMGSAAMDHQGDLAVGYSVSGVSTDPSIRYAGRLATDPPNGLFQGEASLQAGTFVQENPLGRWGDYSALSVDPVDDCTFWYTNEYYQADDPNTTAEWQTRIGRFSFPACSPAPRGIVRGVVTLAGSGAPIAGALVRTTNGFSRVTDAHGAYSIAAPPGNYEMSATGPRLVPSAAVAAVVVDGGETIQNFVLDPLRVAIVNPAGVLGVGDESCLPATGTIDPGESLQVGLALRNDGTVATSNLVASLEATGGVTAAGPPQVYGALAPGAAPVARTFSLTTDPALACGGTLTLTLDLRDGAADKGTVTYEVPLGGLGPPIVDTYDMINDVYPIRGVQTFDIPIPVPDAGTIRDVDAGVRMIYPQDSDLVISVVHPDGTVVDLVRHQGLFLGPAGANFGAGSNSCFGSPALFDDSADFPTSTSLPPFLSPVRPFSPLAAFNGRRQEGLWKLRIRDDVAGNAGLLGCARLRITRERPLCCPFSGGEPAMVPGGRTSVASESCAPGNGHPDPEETVTVALPLRNAGTGATSNLVATLLPGGGVESPGAPQSYGVVGPVGPPTAREFSFVARGACGSDIDATLSLEDVGGAGPIGTVTLPIRLGADDGLFYGFANPASIATSYSRITGAAFPYPSTIEVLDADLPGPIAGTVDKVTVDLFGVDSGFLFADDLEFLLVGPDGRSAVLMSNCSQGYDPMTVPALTFDDDAPGPVPIANRVAPGAYRPTQCLPAQDMPAPAPPGPYANPPRLSVFKGSDPNGTWSLYARGGAPSLKGNPAEEGFVHGGWRLNISTTIPDCCSESCALDCPPSVSASSEPGRCGAGVSFASPAVHGTCGVVSCDPPSGAAFGLGTTPAVCTARTASNALAGNCGFDVSVNAPTTTRVDPVAVQYSDVALASAGVRSEGCPSYAGALRFLTDGSDAGSAPVSGDGAVSLPIRVLLPQGAHALGASFQSATPGVLDSQAASELTVLREDATVTPVPAGLVTVPADSAGGSASSVPLAAAVTEVADGSPGDIAKATPVTFTLTPVLPGATRSCVAASGSVASGTLATGCRVADLPVNLYDVAIRVGGDYYSGSGTAAVMVFDPRLGSASGGGSIVRDGVPAEFQFNARYGKRGELLGSFQYVENRASGDVGFSATKLAGLAIEGAQAVFAGSGTLGGVPGYGFRVTISAGGRPGAANLFGLQLTDPAGAPVADLSFAPVPLAGGNVKVGPSP